MRAHFRRINVLPPCVTDIDRTCFAVVRHQPDSVGQAAVAILFGSLQISKDLIRTNEKAGVNRIVMAQIFSDRHNLVASCLNFHGIVKINH